MITIDQAQFFANLQLTQAYYQHQVEQKEKVEWTGLQSIINPIYKEGEWFVHMPGVNNENPIPWGEWVKKTDPYCDDSFVELFRKQIELKQSVSGRLNYYSICLGKILVIEYGANIPDGAVESETEAFFDEWDLPPIDTWFYNDYSLSQGGILFAWIPEKFVALADKAIRIQLLGILKWFEKPRAWVSQYDF